MSTSTDDMTNQLKTTLAHGQQPSIFGITAQINGFQRAIQQLDAFGKIGNMV